MQHEAGKWRGAPEETPNQQPMRAGLKPAQRKAPTADQKRVRREMGRKTAYNHSDFLTTVTQTFDEAQARRGSVQASDSTTSHPGAASAHSGASASPGVTGAAKTAEHRGDLGYRPGERTCQACGNTAHPAMGDTGPVCSVCGSYSLVSPPSAPTREERGEAAEYRSPSQAERSGDYSRVASLTPTLCPVCTGRVAKQASGGSACTTCGCRVSDQPIGEPRTASLSAPRSAVARRAAEVYELMKENPL